jgi:predicted dehydrogenase
MNPINLSLIGIGNYGLKLAHRIRKVPSLKILSCYHPDPDKCRNAAKILECKPAVNEKDAVAAKDIHAVAIATPDPSHYHYITLCVESERHIFVEKPMVGSWKEALLLKKDMDAYRAVFCVGHNMRREAGFRYIKKQFDDGVLGDLVTFHINLSHGGAFNWEKTYWRTKPDLCREGPLRVNGVHASDILEYLFGPIDSVYAKISTKAVPERAPDSGIAFVQVGSVWGTISTHWVVPSIDHFQFQFTEAIIDYDLKRLNVRYGRDINCVPTETQKIPLPDHDSRLDQFEDFAQAIQEAKKVETGFYEGFRAVMFIEACYRSSQTNCPIKLTDVLQ